MFAVGTSSSSSTHVSVLLYEWKNVHGVAPPVCPWSWLEVLLVVGHGAPPGPVVPDAGGAQGGAGAARHTQGGGGPGAELSQARLEVSLVVTRPPPDTTQQSQS